MSLEQADVGHKCKILTTPHKMSGAPFQGPKGEGAEYAPKAPGSPPSPIHEKTLMSRNDF